MSLIHPTTNTSQVQTLQTFILKHEEKQFYQRQIIPFGQPLKR